MTNRDVWDETDADSPYDAPSRALVDLSTKCRDLAISAREMVAPPSRADAGTVANAAQMRADADDVLDQAVVAARAGGTSWEDIGRALGVTRQEAHRRYRRAEQRWTEALADPDGGVTADGTSYSLLSEAARDPFRSAADLDAWLVAQPREPGRLAHDPRPVSAVLRRMGTLAEQGDLITRRRRLAGRVDVPAAELAALCEREAVLYERVAASGVDPAGNREAAVRARARAAELRADDTTTGA